MPTVEEPLPARIARAEEEVPPPGIKPNGELLPQAGPKLLMTRTASLAGTLGGSEFDSAAVADAASIATAGAPQGRNYRHDLGSVEGYVAPYATTPTLVVFAPHPAALEVVRWAPGCGLLIVLA